MKIDYLKLTFAGSVDFLMQTPDFYNLNQKEDD
jgi:hypothetical protein